jgi:hypothetical protein
MDKVTHTRRRRAGCLRRLSNERGSVLALVTLLLIVFLGLAALAIDLGLLYVARSEAQRAADAAAHAGAGYLMWNLEDEEGARQRAREFGLENSVRGVPADVREEVDVDVELAEAKVRARVHRTSDWGGRIETLFAGVLGIRGVDVSAVAAAQVWPAHSAECILPLAIADQWCEEGTAENCDRYADPWVPDSYEPETDGDVYVPWIQNPLADERDWRFNRHFTGYNSNPPDHPTRPGNLGETMLIKPPLGAGTVVVPGNFNAVVLPGCDPGASCWEDAIAGCSDDVDQEWRTGDLVTVEPGAMAGPTRQGFQRLINSDPNAVWNEALGCVTTQGESTCRGSTRIRPIPVFDPDDWPAGGRRDILIVNLVAAFVESVSGQAEARVRFVRHTGLTPMSTMDPEALEGSFHRVLRIVE